jgi:hypothetical protein
MGWAGRGRMTFKGSSEAAAQTREPPAGFCDRRRRLIQRLVSGGSPPGELQIGQRRAAFPAEFFGNAPPAEDV